MVKADLSGRFALEYVLLCLNLKGVTVITDYLKTSSLLKNSGCRLLKKIQRRGAREIDELSVLTVRCSEAIERNEAYGSFSAAC
jgi:hypothetical protein